MALEMSRAVERKKVGARSVVGVCLWMGDRLSGSNHRTEEGTTPATVAGVVLHNRRAFCQGKDETIAILLQGLYTRCFRPLAPQPLAIIMGSVVWTVPPGG